MENLMKVSFVIYLIDFKLKLTYLLESIEIDGFKVDCATACWVYYNIVNPLDGFECYSSQGNNMTMNGTEYPTYV